MKLSYKINLILLTLLLGAGNLAFAQEDEYELRYKLKSKQQYTLNVISQQVIEQDLDGMAQTIHNLFQSDLDISVDRVIKDTIGLSIKYRNLHLEVQGPMGEEMVLSSEGNMQDPINQLMRKMINQPVQVVISPRGEVLDVAGVDEMMDSVMIGLEELDESQKQSLKASLDNQFGKENFKTSLLSGLIIYPENPVKVGEEWTCSREEFATVPVVTETSWTLNRVRRGLAELTGTSQLTGLEKNENDEVKMEGTQEITASVDLSTGLMTESNQQSEIIGVMILPPNEYFDEPVEIPLLIKTVTRTRLNKK
ncbi:hypothetical protein KI659_13000 [Litoribacter alkaliphilus]|uniref:Uncharacterized protein n=1 Tax=Litoribacter ruber TaxID=702568 RepID=A0AAP2G4W9_9BACT|nr:DUF6263 family protein [Litoribacter alkaliphilus]MBS9524930.1 hypothetical protein [Litoribacter alkaliphilus]